MKPTTRICCGLRNVGSPNDSEEWVGELHFVMKELVSHLLKITVNRRIDISFGRSMEEVRLGLDKRNGSSNSIQATIDEMFNEAAFKEELDKLTGETIDG